MEVGASQTGLVGPSAEGRKRLQYLAALTATLGALAAGTTLSWSSPVVFKITQPNNTEYNFPVSEAQANWVASAVNLGAAAVSIPVGLIMDRIGRRTTMILLVIPITLGWLLITYASNVGMLIAGRFMTGFSGGSFCVTTPAYISEIAQDSIRGKLGSYFQLMINIGILFSYAVGSYTSVFVFNILCTLIPIIFGVLFFFMPESPNFLVVKGRNEEAREALIRLRGSDYDVDSELKTLQIRADLRRNNTTSFTSVITKKSALKAMLISYSLIAFLQLSGINVVLFNTSAIFFYAGATIPAEISSIIIGVIQVVTTFVSGLVVDKLGRRILLMLSSLIVCICITALGAYFFLLEQPEPNSGLLEKISWLPLVSLSLYVIACSLGIGPIPWIMCGELCLIEIKGFVASTAGMLNWVLSFALTSTYGPMTAAIGTGQVFWIFSGFMLIAFLFSIFVIPETKGKSVDEIQVLLGADSHTNDFK